MNKFLKIGLFLSTIGVISSLTGCGKSTPQDDPKKKEEEEYVEEVITFTEIMGAQDAVTIKPNETKTFKFDGNNGEYIGDDNYFQLLVKTTKNIKGSFTYVNADKTSVKVSEEFYIESTDNGNTATDFRQFLDAFRPKTASGKKDMSVGNFSKILKSIEFYNQNNEDVSLTLEKVNLSDRKIDEENKMIYLKKDYLKIGMDLLTGGTLSYLEKTEYDGDSVDLVIDKNNNIQIGVDYSSRPGTQEVSNNVNLINIYDAGRQIQQSYYGSIGGYGETEEERKDVNNEDGGTQNGYTRNISTTADKAGYYWPYNPVQGGDEVVNFSQVIDFRRSKDQLYCKTRALDWAGHSSGGYGNPTNNRVTKSYMENWFKIKDGLLYTTNRFVDWNGFYDLEDIPAHNIEMPATYISHPLHVYKSYIGTVPFKEDEYGNLDNSPSLFDVRDNLGTWKNGGYRTNQHVEDWFAWTNDEDFGVGVYIPGATYYSSGRSAVGIGTESKNSEGDYLNKGANASPMASTYLYNKAEAKGAYDPCYVRNTSYTAPVKAVKIKEYIPLEYTYVIAVDYVSVFRESFRDLYKAGEISAFNNAGLNAWN